MILLQIVKVIMWGIILSMELYYNAIQYALHVKAPRTIAQTVMMASTC